MCCLWRPTETAHWVTVSQVLIFINCLNLLIYYLVSIGTTNVLASFAGLVVSSNNAFEFDALLVYW